MTASRVVRPATVLCGTGRLCCTGGPATWRLTAHTLTPRDRCDGCLPATLRAIVGALSEAGLTPAVTVTAITNGS